MKENHQSLNMMIVCLFCFSLLCLQISNSRTSDAVDRYYGVTGEDIKVKCSFSSNGKWKVFCRENCEKQNILIESDENSKTDGRYRIEYNDGSGYPVIEVSISSLTQSDSGRYRCGLTISSKYRYKHFILLVVEDVLDGKNVPHLYKEAGSSLTVACFFKRSGRKRLFCRGRCEEDNVLVQTDRVRDKRGRYSTECDERDKLGEFLLVTITNLTQSDSGRYQCYLDIQLWRDSFRDFELTVKGAEPITTTTRSLTSSSASFTHAEPITTTTRSLTSSSASFTHDVLLVVGLTLGFILLLLTVALLVFCRKRSEKQDKDPTGRKKKNPAVETNLIYEEVRDDENKSGPVEISTVYALASYCKPAEAEASDVYSLVTAVLPQSIAEDDLGEQNYAQVKFSTRSSDCPLRSSGCNDVVYSLPRLADGSHAGEESLNSNTA